MRGRGSIIRATLLGDGIPTLSLRNNRREVLLYSFSNCSDSRQKPTNLQYGASKTEDEDLVFQLRRLTPYSVISVREESELGISMIYIFLLSRLLKICAFETKLIFWRGHVTSVPSETCSACARMISIIVAREVFQNHDCIVVYEMKVPM